jgi:two-component system chemotaxis response regulator CheB
LLPRIPADIDAGIVLVQHMPESFTAILAHWLDEMCELSVTEAREGDLALPGRVLVAPASAHMKLRKTPLGPEVILERSLQVNGHMPSVDVLFSSVARAYGPRAVGIIMTGMGSDGAQGLGEIKRSGGITAAQDRESCSIFGMPRVAIEKGFAEHVLPLGEIASFLEATVGLQPHQEETYAGIK